MRETTQYRATHNRLCLDSWADPCWLKYVQQFVKHFFYCKLFLKTRESQSHTMKKYWPLICSQHLANKTVESGDICRRRRSEARQWLFWKELLKVVNLYTSGFKCLLACYRNTQSSSSMSQLFENQVSLSTFHHWKYWTQQSTSIIDYFIIIFYDNWLSFWMQPFSLIFFNYILQIDCTPV